MVMLRERAGPVRAVVICSDSSRRLLIIDLAPTFSGVSTTTGKIGSNPDRSATRCSVRSGHRRPPAAPFAAGLVACRVAGGAGTEIPVGWQGGWDLVPDFGYWY